MGNPEKFIAIFRPSMIQWSAVRARLAAGAPPPVMLDEGHRARIDRCESLAWRSLFDK